VTTDINDDAAPRGEPMNDRPAASAQAGGGNGGAPAARSNDRSNAGRPDGSGHPGHGGRRRRRRRRSDAHRQAAAEVREGLTPVELAARRLGIPRL
jgi:hypothetical protein